jgi:dTDP-4-amino-4,6-dideoxygalactose transaminase
VAVTSGTSALHLGLLAAGIGPGDEVVVPSFTFAATANAVALAGAVPVFADIDAATFCLDPASVEAVLTERTAAVMPVHLYGHPADMPALVALAQARGLAVFEDAAQAHDAELAGTKAGAWGTFAAFSFYPTKNMTAGEGGMVTCADAEVARQVRLLRNQGMERQYANEVVGFNTRMTDLHAAIGRAQLPKLAGWTARRREIAARYDAELRGTVTTPPVAQGARHVYHQYTVRIPSGAGVDRDGVATALREEHGIGTGVYYPTPVHRLAPFAGSAGGSAHADLPATEVACTEVLSLPVHPSLTEDDVDRVVAAVRKVCSAGA